MSEPQVVETEEGQPGGVQGALAPVEGVAATKVKSGGKTPDDRLKQLKYAAEANWLTLRDGKSPELEDETALQFLKRKAKEGFPEGMSTKERHGLVDSYYEFMTQTRCKIAWKKIQGAWKFFGRALPKDFIDPVQIRLAEVVAGYETSKDVTAWLKKASQLLADLSGYEPLCPECGKENLRLRNDGTYFRRGFACENKKRVESGGSPITKPKAEKEKLPVTPKELVESGPSLADLAEYYRTGHRPDEPTKGKPGKKGKQKGGKVRDGEAEHGSKGRGKRSGRSSREGSED